MSGDRVAGGSVHAHQTQKNIYSVQSEKAIMPKFNPIKAFFQLFFAKSLSHKHPVVRFDSKQQLQQQRGTFYGTNPVRSKEYSSKNLPLCYIRTRSLLMKTNDGKRGETLNGPCREMLLIIFGNFRVRRWNFCSDASPFGEPN